jgi:hypothetical protein
VFAHVIIRKRTPGLTDDKFSFHVYHVFGRQSILPVQAPALYLSIVSRAENDARRNNSYGTSYRFYASRSNWYLTICNVNLTLDEFAYRLLEPSLCPASLDPHYTLT